MTGDKKMTDIIQLGDSSRPWDPSESEKSLLLAILQSAVVDLGQNGKVAQQAVDFFLDVDDDYIFSFRSICDYLSIDHRQVLKVVGLMPIESTGKIVPRWEQEAQLRDALEALKIRL